LQSLAAIGIGIMFPMLLLFKDYVIIGIGITFPMYSKGKYQRDMMPLSLISSL